MNVGTLNVNMTMNSASLAQQATAAVGEINKVGTAASSVNKSIKGAGDMSGRFMQSFGQLAEDATANWGNAKDTLQGIQFGIRGAGNNLAQIAGMFSPMAAGLVGIGLGITSLVLPALRDALGYTKEWEESIERAKKQMLESIKATGDMAAFTRGFGADAAKAFREFTKSWDEFVKKLQSGDAQIKVPVVPTIARDKYEGLVKEYDQETARIEALRQERSDRKSKGPLTTEEQQAFKDDIQQADDRRKSLARKIDAVKPFADQERAAQLKADAETLKLQQKQDEKARQEKIQAEQEKLDRLRDVKQEDEITWRKFLIDEDIKANNVQLKALSEKRDALMELGMANSNGPTAAMEAGSTGAFSSVARATMGTVTLEDERKAQLRELELQTKELQKIGEKLNLRKAEL